MDDEIEDLIWFLLILAALILAVLANNPFQSQWGEEMREMALLVV